MSGKEPTWDGAYLFTTLAEFIIHEEGVASTGSWWIPLERNLTAAIYVSWEIIFLFFAPLATTVAQAFSPGLLELPKGSQPCSQSDSWSTWQTRSRVPFCGTAALVGSLSCSEIFSGSLLLGKLN